MKTRARTNTITSTFVILLTACSSAPTECPTGTQHALGACRTSCTDNAACLLSERCEMGACIPMAGQPSPEIVLFELTPRRVVEGEPVRLDYSVLFADRVVITGTLADVPSDAFTDSKIFFPQSSATYQLIAYQGEREVRSAAIELIVDPGVEGLAIERFLAAGDEDARITRRFGDALLLEWSTLGATELQLREDSRVLMTAIESGNQGRFVVYPQNDVVYTLIAKSEAGQISKTIEVNLLIPPRIELFEVQEEALTPSSNLPFNASWRVTGDGPINVWLETEDGIIEDLPAVAEAFAVKQAPHFRTQVIRLVAQSPMGTVSAEGGLIVAAPEQEPNNFENPNSTELSRIGGLSDATDEDWFLLNAPQGGIVGAAAVPLGVNTCLQNLSITLMDTSGQMLAPSDGDCAPFSFGANLPPGDYLLKVSAQGKDEFPLAYGLLTQTEPPGCGDGIPQTPEDCDDGNRSDLDGCNRACMYEPDLAYYFRAAPGLMPRAASPLSLNEDAALIPLPFSFPFFGNRYEAVFVHTNGFITFLPGQSSPAQSTLPDILAPNATIALFAGSLRRLPSSNVAAGETPRGGFQIIYENIGIENGPGQLSGRITLNADGVIRLDFGNSNASESVFIGAESASGAFGLSLCDGPCDAQNIAQITGGALELAPERLR